MRLLWQTQLLPLCQPDNDLMGKLSFVVKPHITMDKFLSGDDIMSFVAEEGFGVTMTC